jgi:mannan polymerase II complex MNN10 subunit
MSLSRSPSPHPNGGWYSKGLTDDSPPRKINGSAFTSNDDQWAAARARSQKVRGIPHIQTKNEGFFQRSKRKISSTLPTFNKYGPKTPYDWREAEKLGRGRWYPRGGNALSSLRTFVGNVLRRFKFLFIILAIIVITTVTIAKSGEHRHPS